MPGPILVCFDGSDGSRRALHAAGEVLAPGPAVVVTVWLTATTALARAGGFMVTVPDEQEVDAAQEREAQRIADEGAAAARDHGYEATSRAVVANDAAEGILAVAEEIDASVIVCGQRGRGVLRSALLGSVSHALSAHTRRPVLIAPEHPPEA